MLPPRREDAVYRSGETEMPAPSARLALALIVLVLAVGAADATAGGTPALLRLRGQHGALLASDALTSAAGAYSGRVGAGIASTAVARWPVPGWGS